VDIFWDLFVRVATGTYTLPRGGGLKDIERVFRWGFECGKNIMVFFKKFLNFLKENDFFLDQSLSFKRCSTMSIKK